MSTTSDMSAWPSRRNKSIPCSLCGNPTNAPKGVCNQCVMTYKEGVKAIEARAKNLAEGGGEIFLFLYSYHHLTHFMKSEKSLDEYSSHAFYPDNVCSAEGEALSKSLRLLIGDVVPRNQAPLRFTLDEIRSSDKVLHGYAPSEIGDELPPTNATDIGDYALRTSPEKAKVGMRAMLAVRRLIAMSYKMGYRDGSNLLAKIALGQLSIEETNDKFSRR